MTLGDIKEKSRRYDLGLVADDYFEKQGPVLLVTSALLPFQVLAALRAFHFIRFT